MLLQIAEVLHMSLSEVRNMPASEVTLWHAYFNLKNKPVEVKPQSDLNQFVKMMGKS